MKKFLIAAVVAVQLIGAAYTCAYAENEDAVLADDANAPAVTDEAEVTDKTEDIEYTVPDAAPVYKADTFTVNFTVEGTGFNEMQNITFGLYDGADKVDEQVYYIHSDDKTFSVTFHTPEYDIGKQFTVACIGGAYGIRYYDDYYELGAGAPAVTYAYTDESGQDVVVAEAAMNILTVKEKKVNLYVDGTKLSLNSPPRCIFGIIMVPVRETAEALGVFDVTYNSEYDSVRVSAIKGKETLFNIGHPWTTVNGVNKMEYINTIYINGVVYVPASTLAEGVASKYEQWDHDAYADIMMGRSKYIVNYIDKVNYVTKAGLTSKTDYLIWVSKANYEVNVFKNSGGVWNFVNSYKCAIGAPSTPTCVGTYRYYEKIARWPYPDFYVGPVMRFNGGYAIHSTLLKYDGTDYNRTVGKKLSHGCVRVQPPDMDWLIKNIPMYTTIHVTDI